MCRDAIDLVLVRVMVRNRASGAAGCIGGCVGIIVIYMIQFTVANVDGATIGCVRSAGRAASCQFVELVGKAGRQCASTEDRFTTSGSRRVDGEAIVIVIIIAIDNTITPGARCS